MFEQAWQQTRDANCEPEAPVSISTLDLPVSHWTSVPLDNGLLNHILLLFWTWDTFINRVIDRTMFEESMKTLGWTIQRPDGLVFCSPFLVNCLLAVGCVSTSRIHSARTF